MLVSGQLTEYQLGTLITIQEQMGFERAVRITADSVSGNTIVILKESEEQPGEAVIAHCENDPEVAPAFSTNSNHCGDWYLIRQFHDVDGSAFLEGRFESVSLIREALPE